MSYDPYDDDGNAPIFMDSLDESYHNQGDYPISDLLDDYGLPLNNECAKELKRIFPQMNEIEIIEVFTENDKVKL